MTKGELEWHRPNRMTLQNLLKHPIYAGAYAYGRRQVDPRRQQAGRPSTGRVVAAPGDWLVLIKDVLPAYSTWEQYEQHLARLTANQSRADELGAPRHGSSLRTGLVVCGICGWRMTVRYGGATNRHTYLCSRQLTDYGGAICQYVAGPTLDQCIQQQVFQALTPTMLDVALAAAQQLERERADLDRHWRQRLERAAYAADRAGRQYRLAEPEHRLVVRQLERAWNDCLSAQQQLEEAYHRFRATQPRQLTTAEQTAIRQLAADIPALWDAPTTTNGERKDILRQVLRRVVVTAHGATEQVQVILEWAGGMQTQVALIRPAARLEQLSYYPQLCARIRVLVGEGRIASALADQLNAEGYRPPKRRDTFGEQGVRDLLHRLGLSESPMRGVPHARLPAHAWYVQPLARRLEMPVVTLHHWIRRGWVQAVQQDEPPRRWVVWADTNELERLRQLHQRPAGDATRRRWVADDDPRHGAASNNPSRIG